MIEISGISSNAVPINIDPYYKDTGDLEGLTKTIVAVEEPIAVDYTSDLLIVANPQKVTYKNVGLRIGVTIDSFNAGATTLLYNVRKGATPLIESTFAAPAAAKLYGGNQAITLFTQGSNNTFDFRFWVDAGNVVISAVELWIAVGGVYADVARRGFDITHYGIARVVFSVATSKIGTGAVTNTLITYPNTTFVTGTEYQAFNTSGLIVLSGTHYHYSASTVATDLSYIDNEHIICGGA